MPEEVRITFEDNMAPGHNITPEDNKQPEKNKTMKISDLPELKKSASSFQRMMVLFGKTWSDLFSFKKLIILTIIMVSIPMITLYVSLSGVSFGNISIYSATMKIVFTAVPYVYFISLGLIYCIFIGAQGAGQIADEVDRGTMLILVSKPIGRIQIFLAKYLALFVFGALVSFLALFLIGWVSVLLLSGNIQHFIGMIPILLFLFFYSLFLNLVFLSITMALSSIMLKGKKVGGVMLLIVILTFVGFFMIRLMSGTYYTDYYLYYIDIGYHMGNVFVLINDLFNALPASAAWQVTFNMFTGVYDAPSMFSGGGSSGDSAQNIDLGGYPLNGLVHPLMSLVLWLGITVLLVVYGLIKLKTKEISN